jgi:predicted nucleic acid-binding protein
MKDETLTQTLEKIKKRTHTVRDATLAVRQHKKSSKLDETPKQCMKHGSRIQSRDKTSIWKAI